jgi:hypothetical protein
MNKLIRMPPNKEFDRLREELRPYWPTLSQAAEIILDQEVSSYPIFVLHQQQVHIGVPLIEGDGENKPWSVNVSTLEELAAKKVVDLERVDDFRSIYKDPRRFFCLLTLSDAGADFVFLPR